MPGLRESADACEPKGKVIVINHGWRPEIAEEQRYTENEVSHNDPRGERQAAVWVPAEEIRKGKHECVRGVFRCRKRVDAYGYQARPGETRNHNCAS